MNRFPAMLLILLAALAAACASTGTGGAQEEENTSTVYVNVENNASADVDVSLTRGGQTLRIGRVQVGDQRRFRVPSAFLTASPHSFMVEVIARDGTGSYPPPSLVVHEGQAVYIEASRSLSTSRYTVR